ncbi:hypothetical protein JCM9152_4408 [Halalkalibacter hemicellulosilyticusJCM 9152]|uniref:Uncharacterized protein n=1 Tax=Halalkalibacter hemicellulosilyticusJCM 9152 TaxID=1236971 RepID=W4QL62_9BACI|nr:hypothetical protein JCM9152_4408 [Halalkalibacter hemicellulosilyticusJCM 9152]
MNFPKEESHHLHKKNRGSGIFLLALCGAVTTGSSFYESGVLSEKRVTSEANALH